MDQEQKEAYNDAEKPGLINIEWQALEFESHEKGPGWFITVGAIALAFFAIALIMANYIFAILIILAVFVVFLYAIMEPQIIKFRINARGISTGDKFYDYQDLKSFWIFYEPPATKELSIKTKRLLMPLLKIPLADQNPVQIRRALVKFLKEEKQEQSLAEIMAKKLRF
ncbi:MAG: hypothetical protein V1845_00775 [bacterium]